MTAEQAKEQGYTHKGKIFGVPCYLTDDEDMNISGTNWFNDQMIDFFCWVEVTFNVNGYFAILKGEKL